MTKNNVNFLAICLLGLMLLLACKELPKNKDKYQVKIGEKVDIFYSTNSCCYYCVSNSVDLKHVKFLENNTIDSGPKDCDGCHFTAAFEFVAISAGRDTICLKHQSGSQNCSDSAGLGQETYVIEVE